MNDENKSGLNKPMSSRKLAIICILIAAVCSGATSVFAKIALETIPPLSFTFIRFLIASIAITPFLLIELRQKQNFHRPSKKVIWLSLIQVVNTIAYSFGVHLTTATSAQMLFSAAPVLTTLALFWLLRERLGKNKILGVGIGFVGTILIILLPALESSAAFNGNVAGNLLVFVAVICLAVYSVLSKQFHHMYSPLYLTSLFIYMATIATAFLAVPDFITHPGWWQSTVAMAWFGVALTGALGATFFLLYQYAVKHGSAVIASLTQYLAPIVTFTIASLLLSEQLTVGFVVGAVLALMGVYLATKRTPQQLRGQ